jgi:hypothetical protein
VEWTRALLGLFLLHFSKHERRKDLEGGPEQKRPEFLVCRSQYCFPLLKENDEYEVFYEQFPRIPFIKRHQAGMTQNLMS